MRALLILALAPSVTLAAPDLPTLMKDVGPAVVRVDCRGLTASGVVHKDKGHVIAPLYVLRSGRPVQVTFADGTVLSGETLEHAPGSEIGVVRLERAHTVAPPPMAPAVPPVGTEVAVIGGASEPRPGSPMTPVNGAGRVAGADDDWVHIDASISTSGGVVFDAEGRLMGLVRSRDGAFASAIPSTAIAEVELSEDTDWGDWVFAPTSGILLGVSDERTMTKGLYTGFRLIGWDRLQVDARAAMIFDEDLPIEDETYLERNKFGMALDGLVGYRFSLLPAQFGPMHLSLSAGLSHQQHHSVLRSIGADGQLLREETELSFTRPAVQVGLLMLGAIELNYTMDINTEDVGASSHRIGIGVAF